VVLLAGSRWWGLAGQFARGSDYSGRDSVQEVGAMTEARGFGGIANGCCGGIHESLVTGEGGGVQVLLEGVLFGAVVGGWVPAVVRRDVVGGRYTGRGTEEEVRRRAASHAKVEAEEEDYDDNQDDGGRGRKECGVLG